MTSIIIIIITIAKILPTCFNISLSCFYIVVVPLHQIFRVVPDLTGHIIITIATILPTCFTIVLLVFLLYHVARLLQNPHAQSNALYIASLFHNHFIPRVFLLYHFAHLN